MSYIKNCTKCGQKISLREMSHGQWVAFDASTDKPHKHGKGSQKRSNSQKQSRDIKPILPVTNEQPSYTSTVVISTLVILLAIYFFS